MPPATPPVADPAQTLALKAYVVEAIGLVFDPEIPVNVYELGLIYEIVIDAAAIVHVTMTLTSPMCPSAQQLPAEVQLRVRAVPGVADAHVEIVWEPSWSMDRMSDAARLQLGL
jgi:FeS assembly SUF system protein